jgi:hypothetical protein
MSDSDFSPIITGDISLFTPVSTVTANDGKRLAQSDVPHLLAARTSAS